MPSIDLEGQQVFYAARGQAGPAVLFVHGAGGTHLLWNGQLAAVSGVARGLALDLPGHGRSAGPGKQTVAEYADVVCRFLDALEIEHAVIVGSSMGGAIAQFLGIHHADRVQSLGLVGTGARLRVLPAFLTGIVQETPRTVALINDALFAPGAEPAIKALSEKGMLDCGPQVLHDDYAACDIFDVREQISGIRAPTLVLCGDQDKMTPVKYSQYLAERIPGAALEIVAGAGHLVMLERPGEVNRSLLHFLERIAAAA